MKKNLRKLIELVSKHTEIIERASGEAFALDAKTISDDVENILCGEYGFYSEELAKKTEKKLNGISLPSRDTEELKKELKNSDISLLGSLYVRFWREAETDGDANPFSDENKPSFLTILQVLEGAVKKEVTKLFGVMDRDYAMFDDVGLIRMGITEGIDTHRNFERLLTEDAHEMFERFGFYTGELVDALEKDVFKGRGFSFDDNESWSAVYNIDDYMYMGTLYVLKWRAVSHGDFSDPFGENNISCFKNILELLGNLVDEIYWACVRYETWISGRKMSTAEIFEDIRKTDKRLEKSFGYSVERLHYGRQCLFDKKSYDYVFYETKNKYDVYRKICEEHITQSGNLCREEETEHDVWKLIDMTCEGTIELWSRRYML